MATKKSKSDSSKAVKADVKKLRSELASAKAKRDRWKKRAVAAEAAAADVQSRLEKVEKKLKKARKADGPATATSPASSSDGSPAAAGLPVAPRAGEVPATPGASDGKPDAGWTVAELRAEARRRGIAGVSRKPKAELLSALA